MSRRLMLSLHLLAFLVSTGSGYLAGYRVAVRDAVRFDYKNCAENIHDRSVANLDAPKGSPVPWNEWCAEHADNVFGGRGWRP